MTTFVATDQGSSWASLPVLLLWMIKDKLDIFDNSRFAAVCRDWRCASTRHPKIEGFPWIWHHPSNGFEFSRREIISVTREECKLALDMPELASATVLFSKEGWLFLKRGSNVIMINHELNVPDCVILVNPLTGAKIILPDLLHYNNILGYFTIQDGYPHRIFVLYGGEVAIIGEAHPGDQAWTNHILLAVGQPEYFLSFIVIGDIVYCKDSGSRNLAIDFANDTWKILPETKSFSGYFVNLDGKLVLIELSGRYRPRTITFYRYNDRDSLWEDLNYNQVMGTSWFLATGYCIVAKGKGLKAYSITQTTTYRIRRGIKFKPFSTVTNVVVQDLATGSSETLRLPFEIRQGSKWVALG